MTLRQPLSRRRNRLLRATASALSTAILASICAAPARAEPLPLWEAGAGAAVVSLPDYRGADQGRAWVLPFPYIVYRGEVLKADERRVRGLFFERERFELDISANLQPPADSGDNRARQGMPDLDALVEIGPSLNLALHRSPDRRTQVELRLPVRAAFATDFSYVDFAGWTFTPNLNVDFRDTLGHPGLKSGILVGPVFSDRRYNRFYYSVDPPFATPERPAYNPAGGYAGTQMIATLSKRFPRFWVGGFARWDTLNGAVFEDSPLVKSRHYFAAGIAVAWMIGESKTLVEATR